MMSQPSRPSSGGPSGGTMDYLQTLMKLSAGIDPVSGMMLGLQDLMTGKAPTPGPMLSRQAGSSMFGGGSK